MAKVACYLIELSKIFDVDLEALFSGNLEDNDVFGGNMKKMCFYICSNCGNMITAMTDTNITCCGKKLKLLQAQKTTEHERLIVERIDKPNSDHKFSGWCPFTTFHFADSFCAETCGRGYILLQKTS